VGRRGAGGIPADSLQSNSNSLQRNSNITATEFQQFQLLWGAILFCSGEFSREMAGFGEFSRVLLHPNSAKLDLLVRN
jgi:hypothetical protein